MCVYMYVYVYRHIQNTHTHPEIEPIGPNKTDPNHPLRACKRANESGVQECFQGEWWGCYVL